MSKLIHFKESQKLYGVIRFLAPLSSIGLLLYLLLQFKDSMEKSDREELILACLISAIILLLANLLVLLFRLETKADNESFNVVVKPFGIKKKVNFNQVKDVELYSMKSISKWPLGWGIRYDLKGNSYFTAKGFDGIRFALTSGKYIIVGTNDVQQASQFVKNWNLKYGSK